MALADEKFITLSNLSTFSSLVEQKIPVYTKAEYESIKSTIPKGTYFCLSDDTVSYADVSSVSITDEDVQNIFNANSV